MAEILDIIALWYGMVWYGMVWWWCHFTYKILTNRTNEPAGKTL